jgi:hypothetical protein
LEKKDFAAKGANKQTKKPVLPGTVVYACNPSYLRGGNRKISGVLPRSDLTKRKKMPVL